MRQPSIQDIRRQADANFQKSRRGWRVLLRHIFEVDPRADEITSVIACAQCHAAHKGDRGRTKWCEVGGELRLNIDKTYDAGWKLVVRSRQLAGIPDPLKPFDIVKEVQRFYDFELVRQQQPSRVLPPRPKAPVSPAIGGPAERGELVAPRS